MPDVTLTGDYHRLRDAIEDEINHHHIHLASGLCECGRFRGKDPAAIRAHAAEEILSALLRFQHPERPKVEPRKDDSIFDRFLTRGHPQPPPLLGVDPGRYRYRMDPKDLMEPPNGRQFIGIYDPPSTPVDIPVEDGDAEQEDPDR